MTWTLRSRVPFPGAVAGDGGWVRAWSEPLVMGVVNVTPDSFSDGGRHDSVERAVAHAAELIAAGADLVDVGGESTRPGAQTVPESMEIDRVVPVIERLAATGAWVSVDTRKPAVARAAVAAGAHLVNDVSGLRDPAMVDACARAGVPAVVVHMAGVPATMQDRPRYDDVVAEVAAFLAERTAAALAAGVPSVLVDPGFGFGKTVEHNLALLTGLARFDGAPVLVGASRKRTIGDLGGEPVADRRDGGSIAAHLFAVDRGAAAIRVHDVAGHVQALRVWSALAAAAARNLSGGPNDR